MCGIDFVISLRFRLGFLNSDLVRNGFGSDRLKKAVRFGYYSFFYYLCNS